MKNIVFVAPHGTGKGTQCALLKDEFGYTHISTGEIIRQTIKKQDDFAKELEKIINSGRLVEDSIVLKMLKDYITSNNIKGGIIFDGFPRTLNQAIALDELMEELNQQIDKVIYLEISKEEALKRTLGRLICKDCKRSYNKFYDYLKPLKENVCDDCQGVLEGRNDDTEEAFNQLFDIFLKDTYPILDYYDKSNKLLKIDASKSQTEMFEDIKEGL